MGRKEMTIADGSSLSEQDYQTQVQRVIEILTQELPTLFEQDISYDIYTQEIFFKDPVNEFKGKFNYRIIFWTLRFHGKLFFTEIFFDVHQIQQISQEIIRVDWTVRGTARLPWKAKIFFNGYSLYKLNEQGLIYDHLDTWDRQPSEILKQLFPRRREQEISE